MRAKRILYVQYGDPAAYPPVEHSSGILAERGWDIVLLGSDAFTNQKLRLPYRPRVRVKNLPAYGLQGVEYALLFFRSLYWTCIWRPDWLYASDPLVLPLVCVVRKLTGVRVVYHEHDAPNSASARSRFMKVVLWCRQILGREAELCIFPQRERLVTFLKATGRKLPAICVWNCPRISEIHDNESAQGNHLVIYYHGSINSARLPREIVVAASRFKGSVVLRIAGYEVPGSLGYVKELIELAAKSGAPNIVQAIGTIPLREELLRSASRAHVGLSLMPRTSDDINLRHMVGASNKPFDFMACGLPLLVTDLPEWTSTFVKPGYARACDPSDVGSIEAQLRWYLEHGDERRAMGRRCAEKIKWAWNYDAVFAEALATLETN